MFQSGKREKGLKGCENAQTKKKKVGVGVGQIKVSIDFSPLP